VYYYLLAILFLIIAVAAVALTVRLVRSRRTASSRSAHAGTCLYVAMFLPYAALQATTLSELASLNSRGANSLDRAATQISSSAAFAAFFGLGFSGKVALVQMWAHVARLHTSSSSNGPHRLINTLESTYKAFVVAVVVIVAAYVTGFSVLTSMYITSYNDCSRLQDELCVSIFRQQCSDIQTQTLALKYYEGIWAVVVLLVFTFLAFLFNGVVFAMCARAVINCLSLCDALAG
jgi:hypothetical protein